MQNTGTETSRKVNTAHAAPASQAPPGGWRTWLLSSSDELRPAKPAPPAPEELSALVALQGRRTAVAASQTAELVEGLQVHPDRMAANLAAAEDAR